MRSTAIRWGRPARTALPMSRVRSTTPTRWCAASRAGRAGAGSDCDERRAHAAGGGPRGAARSCPTRLRLCRRVRRRRARLRRAHGGERRDVRGAARRARRRARAERRRQDDAVPRPDRRARAGRRACGRAGALRRRAADRALAPGLPGERAGCRADGGGVVAAVVAAAGPGRSRAGAGGARARRPGRPRRRDLRRALRRPAPARPARPRARAGRAGAAARRAVLGPRQGQHRPRHGPARRPRRRGPRDPDRHPRRRAGARVGSRAVPEPGAGRVRPAGGDADAADPRAHVRRGDRGAAGRSRRPAPAPSRALMLHALLDPWRDPIDVRALVEVVLLGATGGALGCWILFYRLAYSAESLAHALLPGLVVAALIGAPLVVGGAVGLVVAAIAVAVAGRTPAIGSDTAVAVVVTGLLGLGALLALSPATPARLQELLFGDVLGVSDADLLLAGGLAAIVLAALALLHPSLMLVGFDRASAAALGRSALGVDAALGVLVALAILVAVQGLGNLLVVAVLVAPAAAARRLTRRVPAMMAAAVAIAVGAGIAGLYASFYLDTAGGASIAGALVLAYAGAHGVAAVRG